MVKKASWVNNLGFGDTREVTVASVEAITVPRTIRTLHPTIAQFLRHAVREDLQAARVEDVRLI